MIGLGTLINVAAIVVGGGIGLAGGKRLSSRAQQTLIRGMAVCVLFVAIGGVMEEMLVVENGALHTRGTLMLVVSIALGGLMGELLDLDRRLEGFGRWLREKSGNGRDSRFLDGFITATMTVSIGAMAIVGAVEDGIHGDYTILAAKSLMDFVIILVMASSLGKGCLFSAIPVGLLQGSVTLLARLVQMVHKDPPERMGNQALSAQPQTSKSAQWKRWPLEALQRHPWAVHRKIRC